MTKQNGAASRRAVLATTLAVSSWAASSFGLLPLRRSRAASVPLRIGVLCDMSGIYADDTGNGLVAGVKVAVDEVNGKVGEEPIEIVFADDQNKPDVGTAIAGRWFGEQNVSAIVCASAS